MSKFTVFTLEEVRRCTTEALQHDLASYFATPEMQGKYHDNLDAIVAQVLVERGAALPVRCHWSYCRVARNSKQLRYALADSEYWPEEAPACTCCQEARARLKHGYREAA